MSIDYIESFEPYILTYYKSQGLPYLVQWKKNDE